VQPLGEQLLVPELQQIGRQGHAAQAQQWVKKVAHQVAEFDGGTGVAGVGGKFN